MYYLIAIPLLTIVFTLPWSLIPVGVVALAFAVHAGVKQCRKVAMARRWHAAELAWRCDVEDREWLRSGIVADVGVEVECAPRLPDG